MSHNNNKKIIFAYWGTWQHYKDGSNKFQVTDIDPQRYTHLAYSFMGIAENGSIKLLDEWLDINLGYIRKTMDLKSRNPNLKILVAVGGWNVPSSAFSVMANNPTKRATFINSTKKFLNQHGFDGLDIDWEYPALRDGQKVDVENFVTLLRELRVALGPNKLLTIAVSASTYNANIAYNIPKIVNEVDLINLMTYDFAGPWNNTLGFNAPLSEMKVAIEYWLRKGAPARKLLVGIPFYGRSFTLADQQRTNVGDRNNGAGEGDGIPTYTEICEKFRSGGWTQKWNATEMVPYAYKGNQWITYENEKSVRSKVDLVNKYNLPGAMIWAIEKDDFRGISGRNCPLMSVINNEL